MPWLRAMSPGRQRLSRDEHCQPGMLPHNYPLQRTVLFIRKSLRYVEILAKTTEDVWQAAIARVSNVADFARVLVLDKWACNADGRQAVYVRKTPRSRRYSATFIDQGYCFNAGEWTFPDHPLRGVFANNCVYECVTGWEAFEPALSRAEEIDADTIWRCAVDIPEEWYGEIATVCIGWWRRSTVADASFGGSSAYSVNRCGTRFRIGKRHPLCSLRKLSVPAQKFRQLKSPIDCNRKNSNPDDACYLEACSFHNALILGCPPKNWQVDRRAGQGSQHSSASRKRRRYSAVHCHGGRGSGRNRTADQGPPKTPVANIP